MANISMKIAAFRSWKEFLTLSRPYAIAGHSFTGVDLLFCEIELSNGIIGYGSGSPSEFVCGETLEASELKLREMGEAILGRRISEFWALLDGLSVNAPATPAAVAALDMALFDAFGKFLNIPVVDFFGRHHRKLFTSVTLGIQDLPKCENDVEEYVQRGFKSIKIKIGEDVDRDIEVVFKVQEWAGKNVKIRVDANQGYNEQQLKKFMDATQTIVLECIEQPFPRPGIEKMRSLSRKVRSQCMADEDCKTADDAFLLCQESIPYGWFNIKLMKCGGIYQSTKIASLGQYLAIPLMWGCMDESCISIAAALHAAYAQPNTKLLDLDGSFDLAHDLAEGGFKLHDGYLELTGHPGLGIKLMTS